MALQLEILTGPLRGKRVKLPPGIHLLGRGVGPLPFQDLGLSQEHAKIHVFAHRIEVEDVVSTNGTYVNGSRVARQILKDGDEVRLGPESTFRLVGGEDDSSPRRSDVRDIVPAPEVMAAMAVGKKDAPVLPPTFASAGLRLEPPRKDSDGAKRWVRAAFIIALAMGGGLLLYGLSQLFNAARAEVTLTEQSMESRQEGSGAPDGAAIEAAFEAGRGRFQKCWLEGGTPTVPPRKIPAKPKGRRRPKRKPSSTAIGGRVLLAVTVGPDGRVAAASIKESTLGSKAVEDCVLVVARTLRYPKADGGLSYDVDYPIKFSPLDL